MVKQVDPKLALSVYLRANVPISALQRDWRISEDSTVCQEGQLPAGLHHPPS